MDDFPTKARLQSFSGEGRVMDFATLEIDGLVEIRPTKVGDGRGYLSEVFRQDEFARHISPVEFVQENQSLSVRPGTIRGIHFQVGGGATGSSSAALRAGCSMSPLTSAMGQRPTVGGPLYS